MKEPMKFNNKLLKLSFSTLKGYVHIWAILSTMKGMLHSIVLSILLNLLYHRDVLEAKRTLGLRVWKSLAPTSNCDNRKMPPSPSTQPSLIGHSRRYLRYLVETPRKTPLFSFWEINLFWGSFPLFKKFENLKNYLLCLDIVFTHPWWWCVSFVAGRNSLLVDLNLAC